MKTVLKTTLIILLAALTIVGMYACQRQNEQPTFTMPDGSTVVLTPEESEQLSVWFSLDNMGSQKTVERQYGKQKDTIRAIANFILQYPLRDGENISISNYDKIKISVQSTNRPSNEITNEVDKDVISAIEQNYKKKDFSLISSNRGNEYVMFKATDSGFKIFNGIIITNKPMTKEEVFDGDLMEHLETFELIEENVYYFEAE
jgi:hypothetical protein